MYIDFFFFYNYIVLLGFYHILQVATRTSLVSHVVVRYTSTPVNFVLPSSSTPRHHNFFVKSNLYYYCTITVKHEYIERYTELHTFLGSFWAVVGVCMCVGGGGGRMIGATFLKEIQCKTFFVITIFSVFFFLKNNVSVEISHGSRCNA